MYTKIIFKKKIDKNKREKCFFLLFFHIIFAASISWSQEYSEENIQNPLGVGIGGGIYMPTHSETKELYGSNWFNFNISPVSNSGFTENWVLGGDLDILTRSSKGNRILAVKLALAANKQFGSELNHIIPYLAITGGPVYYDYAFKRLGNKIASKRVGLGASIELGLKIRKNLVINGKYCLYQAPDKLNLNGFSINLLYKIF